MVMDTLILGNRNLWGLSGTYIQNTFAIWAPIPPKAVFLAISDPATAGWGLENLFWNAKGSNAFRLSGPSKGGKWLSVGPRNWLGFLSTLLYSLRASIPVLHCSKYILEEVRSWWLWENPKSCPLVWRPPSTVCLGSPWLCQPCPFSLVIHPGGLSASVFLGLRFTFRLLHTFLQVVENHTAVVAQSDFITSRKLPWITWPLRLLFLQKAVITGPPGCLFCGRMSWRKLTSTPCFSSHPSWVGPGSAELLSLPA